jgi:membrane protease subunit (stomatin/prohibitin family)
VLDMAANTQDPGKLVAEPIKPVITAYGLAIPEFYIENISLPEDVERVLDKRTSMDRRRPQQVYQFSAAEALGAAASKPQRGDGRGPRHGDGLRHGRGAGSLGSGSAAAAGPCRASSPAAPAGGDPVATSR